VKTTKLLSKVYLFVLVLELAVSGYSQTFITNGLVAYYPFNGNARDASGNGNNGTVYGATLTTDRFGFATNAYLFNGVNDYIQVGDTPTLTMTNFLTISAWIKPGSASGAQMIVNKEGQYWLATIDGVLVCALASASSTVFYEYASAFQVTASSEWSQVVMDFNQGALALWVNGISITNFNVNNQIGSVSAVGHDFRIGARQQTQLASNEWFDGSIGDVRIYNRALSDTEIQQLYQRESQAPCIPHSAAATATVDNGFVVGGTINDGGCGYTNTPIVLIQGGGGTGATATAVVSNGVVINVTITDAGLGYTSTPSIFFYPAFGLQIGLIKAVKPSFSGLVFGVNYQLQVSSDSNTWTSQGSPFTATNVNMIYPQYFDVDNFNQLFFRVQVAP